MSTRRRQPQYSISVKVSPDEKKAFADHAAYLGCTQSELVLRAIRSVLAPPAPLIENARQHLSSVQAIQAAGATDPELVAALIESTRRLITTVRQQADRP